MSLSISSISLNNPSLRKVSFGAAEKPHQSKNSKPVDGNPISRKGETMNLIKATFLGGLALGARLLWELFDGDFLFEHAEQAGTKLVDKNKAGVKGSKRLLLRAGATVGILAAAISGFALLYTMLNAPKIAYKGKVNTFTKQKEMDVYINANEVEKNIYTELSEKAKTADDAERDKLKEQYMQMKMAKNEVPDFVNVKTKK